MRCIDCAHLDRPASYTSSNLRTCNAMPGHHWIGDSAWECPGFAFKEESRPSGRPTGKTEYFAGSGYSLQGL